jgi:hypothetical protein
MSYLRGTGTAADPYVIHNVAAWAKFLSITAPCFMTNAYFEVVSDIDCNALIIPSLSDKVFLATLNGNGHKIHNFKFQSSSRGWSHTTGGYSGVIKNIHLDADWSTYGSSAYNDGAWTKLNNVKITIRSGMFYSYSGNVSGLNNGANISNVVIDLISGSIFGRNDTAGTNQKLPNSLYLLSSVSLGSVYQSATQLVGAQRYLPSSYPSLDRASWVMDGVSTPVMLSVPRLDLTTGYAIKGVTRVGNSRKSRDVVILSAAHRLPVWSGKSDSEGKFFAPLYDYYDAVIPLILDDYGYPLKKDTSYVIGDVIHPSTPNGYRYICEQAGTSGPTLPAEPWSVEVLLTAGTAKFRPYPVYEPKCLGPMYPGKVNLITGEKV